MFLIWWGPLAYIVHLRSQASPRTNLAKNPDYSYYNILGQLCKHVFKSICKRNYWIFIDKLSPAPMAERSNA